MSGATGMDRQHPPSGYGITADRASLCRWIKHRANAAIPSAQPVSPLFQFCRCMTLLAAIALLGGCVSARYATMSYDPALIDGAAIFGSTVEPAPNDNPLAVSDAMREFMDIPRLGQIPYFSRFRALMNKLVEEEFFVNQYEPNATYTAAQTFEVRKGNCVAYTNLFVALAREAGLQAEFQLVTGRPAWNVESGYLIKNNHINVVIKNIRVPGYGADELTVDFNMVDMDEDARRRVITDAHANSLFFANLAIDRLRLDDHRGAFAQMKRAILTEPNNQALWNNLGVLYSVMGDAKLAEGAYRTALKLNGRDKTAIAGMAKSLEQQGRLQEAEKYATLAKRYQNRNPYYHFAVAQQAFHNNAFEDALRAINEAIEIKKRSRFYALRAAAAEQLGNETLAEESLRLQHKYRNRKSRVNGVNTHVQQIN